MVSSILSLDQCSGVISHHQSNHKKMNLRSIIVAILLAGLATSCYKETIRVSGEVIRKEVNLNGYTGLRVSNAFNAHVAFSETEEKIIIEANSDIHDRIVVKLEGENLVVGLKRYTHIRGNATLNIYITTKHINAYDISGASSVTLDGTSTLENTGYIEISGASQFTGEVTAADLEIDASGASDIDIYGSVDFLKASLSGASNLREYDLSVNQLDIRLSGASNAFLTVQEKIDVKASGASTLNYKGEAVIGRNDLSGASEIRKRD